jgi:hypothetical protein
MQAEMDDVTEGNWRRKLGRGGDNPLLDSLGEFNFKKPGTEILIIYSLVTRQLTKYQPDKWQGTNARLGLKWDVRR